MRDAAVRIEVGISLRRMAARIGVSDCTLRLYEADPMAVKDEGKRRHIAAHYERLRSVLIPDDVA